MIFNPFKLLLLSAYTAIKKRKNSDFDSIVYALCLTAYCTSLLWTIFLAGMAYMLSGIDRLDQVIDFMADFGMIVYFVVIAVLYVICVSKGKLAQNLEAFKKQPISAFSTLITLGFIVATSVIAMISLFIVALI